MNTLGKSAAVATIVAAIFTVAAYFSGDQKVIIERVVEVEKTNQKVKIESAGNKTAAPIEVQPYTKTETVAANEKSSKLESSIKARHKIALKIPGSITQNSVLEKLAKKATDLGYFDTAFKIALDIKGSITQNSTLSYLAIATAKSGNIEFASDIANRIRGSITKNSTLEQIVNM